MLESKLNNYNLVHKKTGEVIDNVRTISKNVLKEEFVNKRKYLIHTIENNPLELSSYEISEAIKLYYRKIPSIKEYDFFEEYYTTNKKKLSKILNTISDKAYKCFSILIADYTSCENTIQYKNNINILKDKDFAEALNISISTWYNIKKELISYNCIRKISFNKKHLYKINPMIIGHSMKISICTYYAFRNELINEFDYLKVIYWDKKLFEEFGIDVLE